MSREGYGQQVDKEAYKNMQQLEEKCGFRYPCTPRSIMTESKKIVDANGKEIHAGNRVRFATWGMFDVWVKDTEKSGRQPGDPKHVTYTKLGTVEELLREDDGSLHIRSDGVNGVIHLCTKPSWDVRSEFVEVIHG